MSKCKKYISLFWFLFFLSALILLFTGEQVYADNDQVGEGVLKTEIEVNDQKELLTQLTVDSTKKELSSDQNQSSTDEDAKTAVEEEQELMENALEILETADTYWKNGDIENTINELDKAYALLLDTNGDVEIARQKDDLRLLISRRILALYSSQQIKTNGKASEIPYLMNADVEKEIRLFQGPERDFFISSYQRSGMYKEIIVGELRKAGVPEELFWLPLVESGFKVSALSRARALGLWQFIPSTGYKFGLTRDEWIDERMDVLKSTQAAIAYLKELHSMFGDWLTVLAAYNCGEGRVLRVISRQHINYFDRFWDLYYQLPNETARYVPRFLATLHIIRNPEKYGFDLQTKADDALLYDKVKVNKMMKLADIASKMEVSEDIINLLNAELRYKITPQKEYEIKIPQGSLEKFNLVYSDIPETKSPSFRYRQTTYIRHRVRSGESVWSIARRYRVSTKTILKANRINKKMILRNGQIIRIPVNRVKQSYIQQKVYTSKNSVDQKTYSSIQNYKIRKGDSLIGIAKQFKISVKQLKQINNLKTNSIQAGKILKLPSNETEINLAKTSVKSNIVGKTLTAEDVERLGTDKHIVTKGDNLSVIAGKYNIELAKLIKMNNLSENETLTPGQVLVVKQ